MIEEPGLPTLGLVMVISCVVLGIMTNRRFGHKTFHSPSEIGVIGTKRKGVVSSTGISCINVNSRGIVASTRGCHRSTKICGSNVNSSRSSTSCTGWMSSFEGLPESGLLEVVSFLSPADLINVASVSTEFQQASSSDSLWRSHCERMESEARLGEPWRLKQQQKYQRKRHYVKEHVHGGYNVLEQKDSGAGAAVEPLCPCGDGIRRQQQLRWWLGIWTLNRRLHHISPSLPFTQSLSGSWRRWSSPFPRRLTFASAGTSRLRSSSEHHYPASRSTTSRNHTISIRYHDDATVPPCREAERRTRNDGSVVSALPSTPFPPPSCSCCRFVHHDFSWREAFFHHHRGKPQGLVQELLEKQPASGPRRCIVVLHGRVHDLTDFLPSHPGGALILQEHNATDATLAFERFFHSREARRMARHYVVWDGHAVMGRQGTLWRIAHQRRLLHN